MKIPAFLYGTAWKEEKTATCVKDALRAGFRGIDTANQRKHYFEAAVGEALKECWDLGMVERQDLFLQTKFTFVGGQDERLPYDPAAPLTEQVQQSFASSLDHLGTDYVDSYVLHGPMIANGWTHEDRETWQAMEDLYRQNKAHHLGISNVNLEQLQSLMAEATVKPRFVQNRCFARTGWDKEIRNYCQAQDVTYQGFSLLTANQDIFKDPRFALIARGMEQSPAQIVFRFSQQVGILPLTGTTKFDHMTEDLLCNEFELTPEQVTTIEELAL